MGELDEKNLAEEALWERFHEEALLNLARTSRTKKGISDTTSSEDKPKLSAEGQELADRATQNFEAALAVVWGRRREYFDNARDVKAFVEKVAGQISEGLLQKNQSLLRTWDTRFEIQAKAGDIEKELEEFYQELYEKLEDETIDPKDVAAWLEKRLDGEIHPFADGCGRTTKVLSAFLLARRDHSLPVYRDRDEYYREINKSMPEWQEYYQTLFPNQAEIDSA